MKRQSIPKTFAALFALCLCAATASAASARAEELAFAEAERIVRDSFALWFYAGLKDEADYEKPENVIRAALFGLYDARAGFDYEQWEKKERGEAPAPLSTPLFTVDGRSVAAGRVVRDEDNPALFADAPRVKMEWGEMPCNVAIDRQTVELAALRFTGHAVKTHVAPEGAFLKGETYFTLIDGLGDTGQEPVLERIDPDGAGYLLSGTLKSPMAADDWPDASFVLKIMPGDAPGTWKRARLDTAPKSTGTTP